MNHTDYKKMYFTLFNVISDAIQNIEQQNYDEAKELLICAQQEAEELFISVEEDSLD